MLIGGQEDPIGNFGKGIEEVHRYLEDSCHRSGNAGFIKECGIIFVMK